MKNNLGQNWILLRGLARESAHWGDFVPLLQATFPDATITQLDLPGTGCFYREVSPRIIRTITEAVRRHALEKGCLQQPATILAISLGAMVAWEWMRIYQADICGAGLINTSFAGLSPFYHRLRWQSYGKFAALLMKRNVRDRETAVLQLACNRRDQDERISLAWEKIQRQRPISPKNCLRQMLAAASFCPDDTKPGTPILLLSSKGDRLVAPICSETIHRKWNLELRRHPWGGHDLPLDDGAWVTLQLQNWIADMQ